MSKKSIILSAAGLKNVLMKEEEEFVFIIGEKEIKMNKIEAEFISPTVSHIHQCDPTIKYLNMNEYFKNVKQHHKENTILEEITSEHIISTLKNISNGQRIEIEKDEDIKRLRYLSILIHNDELFFELNKLKEEEYFEYKDDEIIEEINFLQELKNINIEEISSKLIEEISTRISKDQGNLMTKVINKFPKNILYLILHNEHFKYDDYDSLYDIINKIFSTEDNNNVSDNKDDDKEDKYDINSFYEIIKINELSSNKYSEFIDQLKYDEITSEIWKQLIEILHERQHENEHNKSSKIKNNEEQKYEFDDQSNHRLNGIIQHLRGNENKNICDLGIIDVTTSSSFDSSHPPKNAVDFDNDNYFKSNNGNAWLRYDFKEKKVRPTRYSIKTRNDSDNQNPVNWVIEVSNTGQDDDWRIIDTRNGNTSVCKKNQSDTFDISTQLTNNEYYRYLRFRSTGKTSGNCDYMAISSLEYFGFLIE